MTKPMRFYYRPSRFDAAGRFVPGDPVSVLGETLAIEAARGAAAPRHPDLADPRPGDVEAVVARRLSQICDTLGLAPDFFAARDAAAAAAAPTAETRRSDHARLAEAFDGLSDPLLRQHVLDLLAQLGSRR